MEQNAPKKNRMKSQFIWPEVFKTGVANYPKTHEGRGAALADTNSGWGICCSGEKPSEKFGEGMAAIGMFLGEDVTPDNVKKMTKEWLAA
jgi:hypothetical protein